jgi:hypothetical protein
VTLFLFKIFYQTVFKKKKEIYTILNNNTETSLTSHVQIRPNNGSLFLYDRNNVKNFKKDLYTWKRRKDGGNSVREDRMSLKINGIDSIYGCYSHNSFITTFHRRCYWLLAKPNIVLVHYLLKSSQNQATTTEICEINDESSDDNLLCDLNICILNANLKQNDYLNELVSILWPYTLNQSNYSLIERLVGTLFSTNQLKKCLKLINFNKIIEKYSSNSLNINIDIPIIQSTDKSSSIVPIIQPQTPKIIQQLNNNDDLNTIDDIFLSKTSILIDESNDSFEIIYIIIKNESKYKLNRNLKYYIQLLNNLIELIHVNTTLLELKLNTKLINLRSTNDLNTYLYFYDNNFNLIFKPFNFNIKFKSNQIIDLQTPTTTTTTTVTDDTLPSSTITIENKYRLLILEKLLYIYNSFKLNVNIDFSLEFESRLVSLVDYLATFLQQQQQLNDVYIDCNIENDENKSLLHLTVICNFKYLFDSLIGLLKSLVYSGNQYKMLYNELNPDKIDCFNLKPIDYAKKFIYYDFITKISDFESLFSNNHGNTTTLNSTNTVNNSNEFILNDDLSWLNEINEQNSEFRLSDDHFKPSQTETSTTDGDYEKLFNNVDVFKPSTDHFATSASILPTPIAITSPYIDDQDKKIKALADNIIAAMPMKIKSNSYTLSSTSVTQTVIDTPPPLATTQLSQQASFEMNDFRQNSIISQSSTNDDIYSSPLGSINSQSPSASSFHIDSPPSTAEFSKYFHSKQTYKTFENDFSQLTLTDDEQRELYEAALIIQNAYRRYLKRKRTRLDNNAKIIKTTTTVTVTSPIITASTANTIPNLIQIPTNSSIQQNIGGKNKEEEDDDDDDDIDYVDSKHDINNYDDENQNDIVETKQYEAACVIQKYFRRYKQVCFKIFENSTLGTCQLTTSQLTS